MAHQIGNINRERDTIKKNQMEILELKSTITEVQYSLERFNNRLELAEEITTESEDRSVEVIQAMAQMEKE